MLVDKGVSLHYSGTPESFFTQVGSYLTRKHYAKLEMLADNTIILRTFLNYVRKSFKTMTPERYSALG
jgi:hypothetical protein